MSTNLWKYLLTKNSHLRLRIIMYSYKVSVSLDWLHESLCVVTWVMHVSCMHVLHVMCVRLLQGHENCWYYWMCILFPGRGMWQSYHNSRLVRCWELRHNVAYQLIISAKTGDSNVHPDVDNFFFFLHPLIDTLGLVSQSAETIWWWTWLLVEQQVWAGKPNGNCHRIWPSHLT